MNVQILRDKTAISKAAAADGARVLREAIAEKGAANLIVATAPSQFEMMNFLIKEPGIDWSRTTLFHLDEYIGLPASHPAGFRINLKKYFLDLLPCPPAKVHLVDGEHPEEFCREIKKVMGNLIIDLAFIGVGENGHIAFNDPPAIFNTSESFIIVQLDEACRRQQLNEGWFPSLDAVPQTALTMSVPQIFQSRVIVNVVPDARKAAAVKGMLEGPVSRLCPASILQEHADCRTYLDQASASLLEN